MFYYPILTSSVRSNSVRPVRSGPVRLGPNLFRPVRFGPVRFEPNLFIVLVLWLFGLFALFRSESITCQHAPRLSLDCAIDDRFDFNRLCDLSTFPLSFGKHSWRMVFPQENDLFTFCEAFQRLCLENKF